MVNTRSRLCLGVPDRDGSDRAVLVACDAAQKGWSFDRATGLLQLRFATAIQTAAPHPTSASSATRTDETCLGVVIGTTPTPGPSPAPPPTPPTPAIISINSTWLVHETDPRYVSFGLDGSYNRGWFQRDLVSTTTLQPLPCNRGGFQRDLASPLHIVTSPGLGFSKLHQQSRFENCFVCSQP